MGESCFADITNSIDWTEQLIVLARNVIKIRLQLATNQTDMKFLHRVSGTPCLGYAVKTKRAPLVLIFL